MIRGSGTSRLRMVLGIGGLLVASLLPAACNRSPVAKSADDLMREGVDALYERRDATAAVEKFRQVLARNPEHYGANFQLAAALDRSGRSTEARPLWEKVLRMAQGYGDAQTAASARERLSLAPVAAGSADPQAALMKEGMDALGARDASAAEEKFRAVLALSPTHYGATFQLAAALDLAGKKEEARAQWRKSLLMAESIRDEATVNLIRPHLTR